MSIFKYVFFGFPMVSIFCAGGMAAQNDISKTIKMPAVPDALRPPASDVLANVLFAKGVQIYECIRTPVGSVFEWKFKAPEAELFNEKGLIVGKHYAGPTWESIDGSTVVGAMLASEPSNRAGSIPWLLLSAKSNVGSGSFSNVRSIQRLDTVGGAAPTRPCTTSNLAEIARVNYGATYYFYGYEN